MQNLGFVYEFYVFNTEKLLRIVFNAHTFVLTWVTDDSVGQGYFIDFTK